MLERIKEKIREKMAEQSKNVNDYYDAKALNDSNKLVLITDKIIENNGYLKCLIDIMQELNNEVIEN